jgi:rsbT antagonist protein RsbS
MDEYTAASGNAIHVVNNCLIVPMGGNLDEDGLNRTSAEIIEKLIEKKVRAVLINVSGITILGSYGLKILKNAASSILMMGAIPVFVGFQPGVVSALVDLDIDFSGILTALTTEDAFDIIAQQESERGQMGTLNDAVI